MTKKLLLQIKQDNPELENAINKIIELSKQKTPIDRLEKIKEWNKHNKDKLKEAQKRYRAKVKGTEHYKEKCREYVNRYNEKNKKV